MGERKQKYGISIVDASQQKVSILGKITRLLRNTKWWLSHMHEEYIKC